MGLALPTARDECCRPDCKKAGAVLDNFATICHGPSFLAMFDNGYRAAPSAKQRNVRCCGLLGLHPMHAHPRHLPLLDLPPGLLHRQGPDAADGPFPLIPVRPTPKTRDVHLYARPGPRLSSSMHSGPCSRGHDIPDKVAGIDKETIIKSVEYHEEGPLLHDLLWHGLHAHGWPQPQHRCGHQPGPRRQRVYQVLDHGNAGHYNIRSGQVGPEVGSRYCIDLSKGTHANRTRARPVRTSQCGTKWMLCHVGPMPGAIPDPGGPALKGNTVHAVDPNFA